MSLGDAILAFGAGCGAVAGSVYGNYEEYKSEKPKKDYCQSSLSGGFLGFLGGGAVSLAALAALNNLCCFYNQNFSEAPCTPENIFTGTVGMIPGVSVITYLFLSCRKPPVEKSKESV